MSSFVGRADGVSSRVLHAVKGIICQCGDRRGDSELENGSGLTPQAGVTHLKVWTGSSRIYSRDSWNILSRRML